MPKQKLLINDGERMIPEFHKNSITYSEHMLRYELAKKYCINKNVLDIASGSGYGTKILAEKAKNVIGVDVNKNAVKYASNNYSAKNIQYKVGSAVKIPIDEKSMDVCVSFETLEHLNIKDGEKFVKEINRVLKDEGVLVLSTPNDKNVPKGNHYHFKEYTDKEIKKLLDKHFKYVKIYYQHDFIGTYIAKSKKYISSNIKYMYKPETKDAIFFFAVCSNSPHKHIESNLIYLGQNYSYMKEADLFNQKVNLENEVIEINKNLSNSIVEIESLKKQIIKLRHNYIILRSLFFNKIYIYFNRDKFK